MDDGRSQEPRAVGDYILGSCIGSGGMGVVYDAHRPGDKPVALKLLREQFRADDDAVRRLHDEAIAGRIVTHPHLVSVIDHGVTRDGIPYLVMPRVRGVTLGDRLRSDQRLSLRSAVEIVRQLLSAIGALHEANIVHGDVKTDNILVEERRDGSHHATVIDLGLARPQSSTDEVGSADFVEGTPEFMAPEIVCGGLSTPASDIYAAGIVLYELICGTTPFRGGSPTCVMVRHVHDAVTPPSITAAERAIPPILDRIVMRALAKDPARRFPNAKAFARALAVALPLLDEPQDDRPTASSQPAHTGSPRRRLARGTPHRIVRSPEKLASSTRGRS